MLDYRIETFLVVCHEMNFTKAAKRLKITQPAVSNHIKQLEEYYDCLLFRYEGKKISLTKEGMMLYEAMVVLHNNEIYLREQINNEKEEKETFRFGVNHMIGEYIMPDMLANYLKKHPESEVNMSVSDTEELLEKLEMGELDFVLLEGNFPKMNYESLTLANMKIVPVCAIHNKLATKNVTLKDLLKERLIIGAKGNGTRDVVALALESKNMSLEDFSGLVTVDAASTISSLVENDCGISFMYENTVAWEIENEVLAKIKVKDWNIKNDICVIWKKDNIFKDYYEMIIKELLFEQ